MPRVTIIVLNFGFSGSFGMASNSDPAAALTLDATDPPKDEMVVTPLLPSPPSLAERSYSDSVPTVRASATFCAPSVVTSIVTELAICGVV